MFYRSAVANRMKAVKKPPGREAAMSTNYQVNVMYALSFCGTFWFIDKRNGEL